MLTLQAIHAVWFREISIVETASSRKIDQDKTGSNAFVNSEIDTGRDQPMNRLKNIPGLSKIVREKGISSLQVDGHIHGSVVGGDDPNEGAAKVK